MIPNSITNLGCYEFSSCTSLVGVYFQGNAPSADGDTFISDSNVTVYYLPGTTGWGDFSANTGVPTALWNPQVQTSGVTFGVRTNRFGFAIAGTSSWVFVVEACTNLASALWYPVGTNTLTGGSSYFSDAAWTSYPRRFYRLRSP
jgi:hypothetical protein